MFPKLRYFKRTELQCKCGCQGLPQLHAMYSLDCIRHTWKKPILVVSGYRCPEYNAKVKGVPNSRHIHGDAFDISIREKRDIDYMHLIMIAGTYGFHGLGLYPGRFIHIDMWHSRRWKG